MLIRVIKCGCCVFKNQNVKLHKFFFLKINNCRAYINSNNKIHFKVV